MIDEFLTTLEEVLKVLTAMSWGALTAFIVIAIILVIKEELEKKVRIPRLRPLFKGIPLNPQSWRCLLGLHTWHRWSEKDYALKRCTLCDQVVIIKDLLTPRARAAKNKTRRGHMPTKNGATNAPKHSSSEKVPRSQTDSTKESNNDHCNICGGPHITCGRPGCWCNG